jgi:hypothetical protein
MMGGKEMQFNFIGTITHLLQQERMKSLSRFGFIGFVLCISALIAWVILATNGNILVISGTFMIMITVVLSLYRIDWSLYLLVLLVYISDQFAIPETIFPLTYRIGYLLNLSTIEYLPVFPEGKITPMEIHLLFVLFIWFLVTVAQPKSPGTKIYIKGPLILFVLTLIMALMIGKVGGGDLFISLWETRAFAYLTIFFLLVPKIIETKEQLQTLIWIMIVGVTFKAFQGALWFASLGFSFGEYPRVLQTLTNHEDPLFFATLLFLLLGFVLFGYKGKQQKALLWLLIPLIIGFVAAQRRAMYAALGVTLLAYFVILSKKDRAVLIKPLSIFLVIFAMYVAAFWNSGYSRASFIALAVRATITGEGGTRGDQDYNSTYYRKVEDYNLAYTFRWNPTLGMGFGRPFQTPIATWDIFHSKLGQVIPHNQVIWIFVKTGAIGGFLFWFFFNSYVLNGARIFTKLSDPYFKAVCAVCVIFVVSQLVVSYVDMQLTWYRNMVHLGILMGLVPVCQNLDLKAKLIDNKIKNVG